LERVDQRVARIGGLGDLDDYFSAEGEACAGCELRPVETRDRDVLADRAGVDRMPFGLQRFDDFERVETERAVGAAVDERVRLSVADETCGRQFRLCHGTLRHTAVRTVQLMYVSFAHGSSV